MEIKKYKTHNVTYKQTPSANQIYLFFLQFCFDIFLIRIWAYQTKLKKNYKTSALIEIYKYEEERQK